MNVCCVFSLESPHQGDSNEYTQYTIFNVKRKITLNYIKFAAVGFFPRDSKIEFETAVVNEPSVFEPLKFCCMFLAAAILVSYFYFNPYMVGIKYAFP